MNAEELKAVGKVISKKNLSKMREYHTAQKEAIAAQQKAADLMEALIAEHEDVIESEAVITITP